LQGPEDVERVPAAVLASWRTAEQAFMAFASSRHGWIEKDELMAMMHEVRTNKGGANKLGTVAAFAVQQCMLQQCMRAVRNGKC
jgi:hypothetical protein